jgi:hypothetical protein
MLSVEALTGQPDIFQTIAPAAQEIERQIQSVWSVGRLNPSAHENASSLLVRLDEITLEMARQGHLPSSTTRPDPFRRASSWAAL